MSKLKIGLLGANGKMGQKVQIVSKWDSYSKKIELNELVTSMSDPGKLVNSDVIIDFSIPEAVLSVISKLGKEMPSIVIGSTGWTDSQKIQLKESAKTFKALVSPNFAPAVLIFNELLKKALLPLSKLGMTPVIVETHHIHKKDTPSGTALMIKETLEAKGKTVQTHAIRAGEVIGDHLVNFYGMADQLSLSHHAQDRQLFAQGAIEFAIWLSEQTNLTAGVHTSEGYVKSLFED